ncbi:MAG TPA: 6,7-dimethyl-8-ribityllumazine synthase [Dehalococcoidia bacterium]|nr:6,7-dimethyl-8-ribityllumazine synthase [Dehalococcoidia bacterium]
MAHVHEGGDDATGMRFAIVVARFNDFITNPMLEACLGTLEERGATGTDIDVYWVPGAFEIPVVAQRAARGGHYDAIICLGAVIQGETDHYRLVADESASGIARVSLEFGIPCIFEVLATPTTALAVARAGGESGNKGEDAAYAAIETARVLMAVRET